MRKTKDALVVEEVQGTRVVVKGKSLLNLASFDFLGLAGRPEVKDAARAALNKYGCGSCGPRGFYGSIDVHVRAEHAMAKFMGAEEAMVKRCPTIRASGRGLRRAFWAKWSSRHLPPHLPEASGGIASSVEESVREVEHEKPEANQKKRQSNH